MQDQTETHKTPHLTHRHGAVDAAALIQFFGGRSTLHAKLTGRGYDISIKGLDKWKERGSVHHGWFGVLAEIAREEGRAFDLTQFLVAPAAESKDDGVLD